MFKFTAPFVAALLVSSAIDAAAADPAAKCESSKVKAMGKYVACRTKADAKAVRKAVPTDPAALAKCEDKFLKTWEKAQAQGAGLCPDPTGFDPAVAEATAALCADWMAAYNAGGEADICAVPPTSSTTTTTTVGPTTSTTTQAPTTTLPSLNCADVSGQWLNHPASSIFLTGDLHESPDGSVVFILSASTGNIVLAVLRGERLGFTITWNEVSSFGSFGLPPATLITDTATCNRFLLEFFGGPQQFERYQSAHCGDGQVGAGEECDDGNADNSDGCIYWHCSDNECFACALARCGDGILDDSEECEDGNVSIGDGCDETCQIETCGNLNLDPGEECDDGNRVDGDGCDRNCILEFCGNNIVQFGEECDGPLDDPSCESRGFDGGSLTCTPGCVVDESDCTVCGDGIANEGEDCDGADLGTCTTSCRIDCICLGCPVCGDGTCEGDENKCNCPDAACAGVGPGTCSGTAVCGDGTCDPTAVNGESHENCSADCPKVGCD